MERQPRDRAPVFSVLRDGPFRTIWYVGSLHELARRMELLVLSLLILEVTDSYLQLLLILAFNNLPRLLISLFSGLIADRISRQRILFVSQMANTATAAAVLSLMIYDFELIRPWHIFLAIAIQGAAKAVEDPSRRTAIFDIVGERRLVIALSLDVISNTAGKMVGPALGGLLVATVGFSGTYWFVLGVHLLNMWLVTRLSIPNVQGEYEIEPVLQSLGRAIGFAFRTPVLMGLLCVTIIMNALAFPVQQFIPAIGRDSFHVGAALVGLLAAAEGFGQLVGAALMSLTRNVQYHGRVFVIGSMAVLVMAVLFVWSPWYTLAFIILTLSGVGQSGFSTMQSAITMLAAPQAMRGRMMGLLSLCIGVGTVLGAIEMGKAAAVFSIQGAISANVAAAAVLMVPALMLTPLLRRTLTQPPPARAARV